MKKGPKLGPSGTRRDHQDLATWHTASSSGSFFPAGQIDVGPTRMEEERVGLALMVEAAQELDARQGDPGFCHQLPVVGDGRFDVEVGP